MGKSKAISNTSPAVSEAQAEEAVRTLVRWAGDDPDRAGMLSTPQRVLAFYKEFFSGYGKSARDYAGSIANEVAYDDFILIKDITLTSFCEHHMLPATGTAHIAYIPQDKIAGLGTIAKIALDAAHRFTTQEDITKTIMETIKEAFEPKAIAVLVSLSHGCMTIRDGRQKDTKAITTSFFGDFSDNPDIQQQFFMLINEKSNREGHSE